MERKNKLVWITGANGLIGNYLVQTAPRFAPQFTVRALTRADFDLLDFAAVRRAFRAQRPQLIIHCAAMSRSPDCQAHPELARRELLFDLDTARQSLFARHGKTAEFDLLSKSSTNLLRMWAED